MNTTPMITPEDDVVWARFRRRLPDSAPARERVAWLGRDDTRARGECLAPGTVVLAHSRFPNQFRADDARNREEFRVHGFTWTDAAAEALAVDRVRCEVERLRADLFRGTISVGRLAETLQLPRDTVLEALRALQHLPATGAERFALRRIPGVREDDPSGWEVVRPAERASALAPLAVRPTGWVRWIWLVYAAVASATLSYFAGKWVGDGNPPAWKAIGTAVLLSGVATFLRRWAERRAEAAEAMGGSR